jgi:hypothetical protein
MSKHLNTPNKQWPFKNITPHEHLEEGLRNIFRHLNFTILAPGGAACGPLNFKGPITCASSRTAVRVILFALYYLRQLFGSVSLQNLYLVNYNIYKIRSSSC